MMTEETITSTPVSMEVELNAAALSKPAAAGLEECLTYYTKDQMLKVAERGGFDVKKSHTKARIAADMAEEIKQAVPSLLGQLSKEEEVVVRDLMGSPIEGDAAEIALPFIFSNYLIERGLVYLFTQNSTFTLVMPEEVAEFVASSIDDASIQENRTANQAIFEHITALINLYGVFDANVLWNTWKAQNTHPSMEKDQFEKAVSDMRGKLNTFEENEGLYFSPKHLTFEQAQSDYVASKTFPFYSPSKEDLRFFSLNEIDTRNPEYEKIEAYIQEKYPENRDKAAQILHEIGMNAVLDGRGQDLIQTLDKSMGLTFESTEDLQQFSALYDNLSNTTRKWKLRGNTPNEARTLQANAMKHRRTRPQAPAKRQPVRVEKIGRNEPCPCGSGKKYKHCHGR